MPLHTAYSSIKASIEAKRKRPAPRFDPPSTERRETDQQRDERERRQRIHAEWNEQEERWRSLTQAGRERLLLELIGEDRLTVSEATRKVREKLGEHSVYYGRVYSTMQRLLHSGELDRVRETFRETQTRNRYFRRPPSGPIVEMEKLLHEPESESEPEAGA
jgi:hypothetical protein